MLEVLENLQHVAVRLSPIVLVLPGLALTVLGLFVWLGGLGFRRLLMGIVGALAGSLAGYCLGGRSLVAVVSGAVTLALFAGVVQRLFAAVLLGALAAGVAFLILAWPTLSSRELIVVGPQSQSDVDMKLTVRESLEIVESHWLDLAAKVKRAATDLPAMRWALVVAAGLGMLAFGFALRRLGGALSCAAAGTLLVFSGLVLLLMFKGSDPVTGIEGRPVFYGLVAGGMIAFGTLEQFLLCRHAERRRARSEKAESEKDDSKRGWRGR